MSTIDNLTDELSAAQNASSPEQSAMLCRHTLDSALMYIYQTRGVSVSDSASMMERIDSSTVTDYLHGSQSSEPLHYVRILGMNAQHGKAVRKKEAELALNNVTSLVEYLSARAEGNQDVTFQLPYMSEYETRKLYVDVYLKEADWVVSERENVIMPGTAGIEIQVQGMPNEQGIGFCDYVLYGRDGKPLAVVEVKKTSINPEVGRHQVDLYGECLKAVYGYKPVLYYTNGYETKIIDGLYPDRIVSAFHTLEELERLIQRRSRGDITDISINENITNRPYQKMAIQSLCEWLNQKHRRGLLVMATGTGKTRVAISLVDILTRNNWVKNVLFLADRTALVQQAKRNFVKLLPNMNVCVLSDSGEKDLNARLMFSTYQTMINYVDSENKQFKSGRFDLIIIDEAHRSIFNRYGSIFQYFDSFLVGLTATPKGEVDANTYHIFGCETDVPNYDYSMEDAVSDGYLVPKRVVNRQSRILTQGLDCDTISPEEREQLVEYLGGEPLPGTTIPQGEFFRKLINKNTCRKVVEEVMTMGLKVNNNETIGKTIIFAYNHCHAQNIVDCFHELYPNYPPNTCQLVDYSVKYVDNIVVQFGTNDEFRIAVSVDMLDTGVDITSVLNLVFFKPVKSKIKFIQMIGRGTRLHPNLFGPGMDKKEFLIFDYCGNFEYFDEHPDGSTNIPTLSLSQKLFQVRLDIVHELQRVEYQQDEWFNEYYQKTKSYLIEEVQALKANSKRIQIREQMQYVDKFLRPETWQALSTVDVQEAQTHLTPLLDSGINGDSLVLLFDVRMFFIEKSMLEHGSVQEASKYVKIVRAQAQSLLDEKASIPQVLAKAEDLKTLASDLFWTNVTVPELERLRETLRDLMQFLKDSGIKQFIVDIEDEITHSPYDPEDGNVVDIRTYRQRVMDYLNDHLDSPTIHKIHNLEPIDNSDLEELERILWHELGSKEDYSQEKFTGNLAAFVRSIIGLSSEAINEKFGQYLNTTAFNSRQQEFIWSIINYVKVNGDVCLSEITDTEPFNEYGISELFGEQGQIEVLKNIVSLLHGAIQAGA